MGKTLQELEDEVSAPSPRPRTLFSQECRIDGANVSASALRPPAARAVVAPDGCLDPSIPPRTDTRLARHPRAPAPLRPSRARVPRPPPHNFAPISAYRFNVSTHLLLLSLPSQRAALEQEAYDEKNKLLNQTQFQELLELQTDEEPDFMEEIVQMYVSDAEEMLSELVKIFEAAEPDYNKARAVLHKLKGSSSTFGADGVQQKCEELREHCIKEDIDACREGAGSLKQLREDVDRLSAFLARYTDKAKEIHAARDAAKV